MPSKFKSDIIKKLFYRHFVLLPPSIQLLTCPAQNTLTVSPEEG